MIRGDGVFCVVGGLVPDLVWRDDVCGFVPGVDVVWSTFVVVVRQVAGRF